VGAALAQIKLHTVQMRFISVLKVSADTLIQRYPWPPLSHEATFRQLLQFIAEDQELSDPRQIAYLLATVRHETAFTFAPVEEYGKGAGYSYGIPDPETGQTYYGRGFVQITWKANYNQFSKLLGLDLVNHPELALISDVSYKITSLGMRQGLFTGLGFSSNAVNINNALDFVQARRIINGLDQADRIAEYAEKFLVMLGEDNG
jgi:hypothetical protein